MSNCRVIKMQTHWLEPTCDTHNNAEEHQIQAVMQEFVSLAVANRFHAQTMTYYLDSYFRDLDVDAHITTYGS